ncbi:hypothetical protein [Streptomyces chartreusis]|uniref:hypothetical protein n=1 Tax=Streptomyces chartreusis TaxID=1969 RepID=UPI002101AF38|nr:hypothetical protein [Streptomyces chartreusis]
MGFSGHLVFARNEHPMLEAPLFGSTNPGLRNDVHEWQPRPGGWQTLQLEQGIWEDECLSTLVEGTGAPACVADASDSSVALVTGLETNGHRWQAWLNPDNAAAHHRRPGLMQLVHRTLPNERWASCHDARRRYLQAGLVVSHSRRPGRPPLKGEEDCAIQSSLRTRIEHLVGWLPSAALPGRRRFHSGMELGRPEDQGMKTGLSPP